MKLKTLVLSVAAAAIVPVATIVGPTLADSPGQIGGGNIYSVKNVTQNGKYANQTNANACDELEYSVRLHNPDYSTVNNIVVKSTLPAGSSTTNTSNLTITYTDGIGSPVRSSVIVNLSSSQSISYENGTSVLYDASGNVIRSLPDGVTNSGVNVGSLKGSTAEYVNFKAKVNCPTPPKPSCKTNCTPVTPPVTPPSTPPTTTTTTSTPTTPTTLVNTGPGDVIGAFSAVTVAGALGYRLYLGRRLARQ